MEAELGRAYDTYNTQYNIITVFCLFVCFLFGTIYSRKKKNRHFDWRHMLAKTRLSFQKNCCDFALFNIYRPSCLFGVCGLNQSHNESIADML